MKKKIIILLSIVIISMILVFTILKLMTLKNFTIPQNYNLKLEDDKSYMDGSDTTYYIYNNKIIEEEIWHYPDGHPYGTVHHRITVYTNLNTSNINEINDVYNLISNKNGKKVYDIYN